MTSSSEQPKEQQQREGKAYYHSDITPEVLENIQIGDWIRGIGDISCPFDQRVVQTVGTWLRMHDTRSRQHPAPALDELKRDLEFKQACIENQAMHINTLNAKMVEMMQGAARKAREDDITVINTFYGAVYNQWSLSKGRDRVYYSGKLHVIKEILQSLRTTTQHTEQEHP